MKKIIINIEEENIVDILEEVKRLVNAGYTSGYNPTWKIEDEEKESPLHKAFNITSVCRADLYDKGFDVKDVDDATMEQLASKMSDAYCEDGFWIDLDILADHLEIKKRK